MAHLKKGGSAMISTKRLKILAAEIEDIEWIMNIEHNPDNRDFIWQGTYDEHLHEIKDPNYYLLKFLEPDQDRIVGYSLIHLDHHSDIFELRRIAITAKGEGYGREAINALIQYAFESMTINRFWLDVYPDNHVAISLYESLGMVKEGVLRQNYKSERGYLDQIVYSLLREEYITRKARSH